MLDAALLRELLDYNPLTGTFIWRYRARHHFQRDNQWKNWNSRYPGTVAGRLDAKGYRAIAVRDRIYRSCRLAWLYHYGAWPTGQIDHINGAKSDDRIENLRDVTNSENSRNRRLEGWSPSGRVGVTPYKFNGRDCWVSRIRVDGRLIHLGYFDSVEDAAKAREAAERAHGFSTWPKTKTPLRSRGFSKTRLWQPNGNPDSYDSSEGA